MGLRLISTKKIVTLILAFLLISPLTIFQVKPQAFGCLGQHPYPAGCAFPYPKTQAKKLLSKLTLDEKIQLVHGANSNSIVDGTGAGVVKGIARLGIPDIVYADSATGVRTKSKYATAFPSNLALAASWNYDLAGKYGQQIALELKNLGFNAGLGGGINLARELRNGRTFEYLGKTPHWQVG